MIDLCKIKEDFSGLVKEAQPWTLTQFVMWLDLKLSEFKIKGYMVLDHNVKTKPKWLSEEDRISDVAPTQAPCRHCHRSDERQFYSDLHASPSALQQRIVTKDVPKVSQQQDSEDIRGDVGIIDLSHGIIQSKNNTSTQASGRNENVQNYRKISHDYHMTEKTSDRDKRSRPDVIEIDAPSPPEKMFISANKPIQKTSTPVSATRSLQKPNKRPSLSLGTAIYTSTSSGTTTTFSSSYISPTSRSVSSNFTNRKYALGAPPATSMAYVQSSNISDYQNLENLIAQTVQYNETLSALNQQTGTGVTSQRSFHQHTQDPRQSQTGSSGDHGPSQTSFIQSPPALTSFAERNVERQPVQSSFSDSFTDQHSSDKNIFISSSEAVPVALHANMDVINRDNSIGSAPSASDITEIKIESDNDNSISDSFITEANTSQSSLVDAGSDGPPLVQGQPQAYVVEPGSGLPKPGLVDPDTARAYQMVELVTGSGVYVYNKNIAQAFKVGTEKDTGTYSGEKMARYLLNVFWSRKELVGATLSKAGRGKKILNQQIIEAILVFCSTHSIYGTPRIKRALHNSVSAATCQAKQKTLLKMKKLLTKTVQLQ